MILDVCNAPTDRKSQSSCFVISTEASAAQNQPCSRLCRPCLGAQEACTASVTGALGHRCAGAGCQSLLGGSMERGAHPGEAALLVKEVQERRRYELLESQVHKVLRCGLQTRYTLTRGKRHCSSRRSRMPRGFFSIRSRTSWLSTKVM